MDKLENSESLRRYRSGEAARLARMPAATLRIWEQRYGITGHSKSASRQRRYSDDDVQRIRLLKALVSQGHAIGKIAGLSREELEALALTSSSERSAPAATPTVVIAGPLAVPSPGSVLAGMRIAEQVDSLDNLDLQQNATTDVLLVSVTSLHEEDVGRIASVAGARRVGVVAVVYAFGTTRALELARLAGIRLFRTADGLNRPAHLFAELARAVANDRDTAAPERALWCRTSRRFDDNTLASLAGLSSPIKCECPRHLTELVLQLSAFERYSDECVSHSAADALLHRHLGNIANRAAEMFEAALAEIAHQEGWIDPDVLPANA
ncbi:Regulatory protein, MerR [Burkholderia multivorans]